MGKILPHLLAWITGHTREKVDIVWSNKSWTHNVFRVWELIFWRRQGIRHESSYNVHLNILYLHSWESVFANAETFLRGLSPRPIRIWIPILQTSIGIPIPASPYLFAIALDTSAKNTGTTYAYTSTGTNLQMVWTLLGDTTDTLVSVSYAAVALTVNDKIQYPADRWVYIATLTNPATGSNNIVVVGTSFEHSYLATYTGCAQSGQPDSHNNADSTTTTPTISTTVVATGCWLVGFIYGESPTATAVSPGVIRQSSGSELFSDSNGTVGTGSQSLQWNNNTNGRDTAIVVVSIAPTGGGGATTVPLRALLGVGL